VNQKNTREVRAYCSDALFAKYLSDQQRIWNRLQDAGFSKTSASCCTERKMILISNF